MPTTTGRVQVTFAPKRDERSLAALLYDDVKVFEQWEDDEQIAVIWTRDTDFLVEYQAARMDASWYPTHDLMDNLPRLAEAFGLYLACAENQGGPNE